MSPVVVVPGDWSEPDLVFQAENVASQKLHNDGFNCVASQVLVLPERWAQRGAFLGEVRRVLDTADPPATPAPATASTPSPRRTRTPSASARPATACSPRSTPTPTTRRSPTRSSARPWP